MTKLFTRGLGLRIILSFLPPISLVWLFFLLYLYELTERHPEALWWAVGLGLVGIVTGSLVVFRLILTTIPPIRHIIDVTATLAKGEMAVEIPYRDRSDETGELARALAIFKDHVSQLQGVAALKAGIEEELNRKRELLSLADALDGEVEGTVKQVVAQASSMSVSTSEVVQAIRRMEGLYRTLTSASEETQVNVNAVAAATDELASASREIAAQMARTISITGDAVTQADTAEETMRDLAVVSARIGEVLKIINDIAGQTNLLALNATIEAARAGEAGKGFAVVANEVKVLASQTAKAVGTIAEQMEGIRAATGNGVKAIEAVGKTIDEVNNVATAVAAAVEEQEASTRQISSSAQNAAVQAQKVSSDAAAISTEVANVDGLAARVNSGAGEATECLVNMEHRLSGILAHTFGADKKSGGHAGKPLGGQALFGGAPHPCRFEEMDLASARLVGIQADEGGDLDLALDEFGPLQATVRGRAADGILVDFVLDRATRARLGEFLFGHEAEDQVYIKLAKSSARRFEALFEGLIDKGDLSVDDLFDRDYKLVPGTNPQQFTTHFLDVFERVLPPIKEEILRCDPKIVFGLAINQDGYIAVHHAHCSKPQGADPVWNAANCRNRRLFTDHTGLTAATNTKSYLLQTYIRDMGGGTVTLLKDASAPITVRGRHWGGFRLGYKL